MFGEASLLHWVVSELFRSTQLLPFLRFLTTGYSAHVFAPRWNGGDRGRRILRDKSSSFLKYGICFPIQVCWKRGSWRNEWPSHSSAMSSVLLFQSKCRTIWGRSCILSLLYSNAPLLLLSVQGKICLRAGIPDYTWQPKLDLWKVLRAAGEGSYSFSMETWAIATSRSCGKSLSFLFL